MIKNKIGALASVARARARPRRMRQLELQHVEQLEQLRRARPCLEQRVGGTISGAGSTFAAPVYQQWASSQSRPDRQLPGRRLRRRHHRAREQDRRLRRQRPAAEARRRSALAKNGSPAVQIPMFLGAITVSYNLPGVQSRPEARRQDDRRHLPRQGQDLERRRDQGAEPRRHAAEHGDHGHPPLGLLGHDRRLHRLPRRGRPRIQEQGRRRQGRAVADRHRRQGQRRRGRRGPADGGRGRLRRAGLRAAAQLHLRRRQEQGRHVRLADAAPRPRPRRRA